MVYSDSDHAGDYVDQKRTSGICTFVRCCLTSWFSKKQTALAISTIEAEYVSVEKACQQALWIKQALINYDIRFDNLPIMCDNKGTIDLSKNPVQHSRTKHIKIRHHFLHDDVQKGHILIKKVSYEGMSTVPKWYRIGTILVVPIFFLTKNDGTIPETEGMPGTGTGTGTGYDTGFGLALWMGCNALKDSWFICNNSLILKKWNPDVNLLKEDVSNVLVWVKLHGVLVTAFSEDGLSAISSYARALIKVWDYVKLEDNIVVAMPKLVRERFYTCNVHVHYEYKPPRCVCCKFFCCVQDECPKNIDLDVVKNIKKPRQTCRGVLVGPKVRFKPVKQVYRHDSKKNNVNTDGNKKKDVEPTIEVTLVEDEGKPLTKIDSSGDHDSKDEVALFDNDMTNFLASKKVGYGTNNLLEQWKECYVWRSVKPPC
nr:copia protein [Tanacetum cinerariifolium]